MPRSALGSGLRPALALTLAGSVLAAAGLAGCGLPGGGPDAGDAAADAARQLASGKLDAGTFADAEQAQRGYDTILGGLGDLDPTVVVDDSSTDGDAATARLRWSWPVAGDAQPWSYTTELSLRREDDRWLVRWQPDDVVEDLGPDERLRRVRLAPERGRILGADDTALVRPRPVVRVGIDKTQVKGAPAVQARRLAMLVGIDVPPYVKQVKASGARAFVPAITYRRDEVPAAVSNGIAGIPGAVGIDDSLPLAPSRDFAAALLGSVGEATAEIVKESKGRIRAGDRVGISGLQLRYDEQLAGTPGVRVEKVAEDGTATPLFTVDPVDGTPLRLTLDLRRQQLAQRVLADVGPASALVAIRPSDGAVLAAASGPGSKGYNTATYGRYAPGSTFKVVSSLALLRAGLTPDSPVACTPSVSVNGKRFGNYDDYPPGHLGRIPLREAVANSCNTAFVSSADRLGPGDLASAAAALGFGVDADTGFPSYFGAVPRPAGDTEAAADLIGQGRITASPMAMATVLASVVRGAAVLPRLLADQEPATRDVDHPLTEGEAARLRAMLRGVVTGGSGSGLADLPGPPVIAKTGTAEFGDKPPLPTHVWMIGAQGDLAVAVFVDRGESGSGTAGPILEEFLRGAR